MQTELLCRCHVLSHLLGLFLGGVSILFRLLIVLVGSLGLRSPLSPTVGDPVEHTRQFPIDVGAQVTAPLGDFTFHRVIGLHNNGQEHVLNNKCIKTFKKTL